MLKTNLMPPDLEVEFKTLVQDDSLGRWFHLRRPYLDDRGRVQKCRCTRNGKEVSSDCSYCFGSGVVYIEIPIQLYCTYYGNIKDDIVLKVGPEQQNPVLFYAISDYKISKGNKIIRTKINNFGKITLPVERIQYYEVTSVETYSSKLGVTEFWKIYSNEVTLTSVLAPGRK